MKNLKKYLLLFFAATIIVSCGDEDLEPVLSLDKDLATGIQSAGDLASVLNSAYDRMTVSGTTEEIKLLMVMLEQIICILT